MPARYNVLFLCTGNSARSLRKNSGLVLDRREGYRIFYRLVQSDDAEVSELFEYLVRSFAKDKVLKADMRKLRDAITEGSSTVTEWKPLSGLAAQRPQAEGA